ncbi:MAG TPA: ATP-binding protein [Vicinamibacterales bacterium]|nr:ATP-binding protein [Vicinamibacterales bacterium]
MAAPGAPGPPPSFGWEIPGDRLFDLVPSAVSVVDRDLRIRRVNAAFRRMFGDRVGESCYSVLKGRLQPCASCPMARSFQDGGVHYGEELVETQSGRPVRMAVQTSPFLGHDGSILGGVEVATDISRSVEQWQELALLGRAIAGLAHYIKNILTGLDGGVFVVEEALRKDDTRLLLRGWDMVRRNVERVGRLSREQLYCARERPAERTMTAPNAVVCEAARLFAPRLTQDDVQLTVELDARVGMGLLDPEGLHNLVTNLLSNALEACRFDTIKTRHWISVKSVLDSSGSYILEVADNGQGIPSEVNARLFCDVATTRGASGTGLGLLVVYHVVSAHGGEVSVLSEEGLGSVFTVTLPLQRTPDAAAPEAGPDAPR